MPKGVARWATVGADNNISSTSFRYIIRVIVRFHSDDDREVRVPQ